jgi:SAM-dependent methyltransferase
MDRSGLISMRDLQDPGRTTIFTDMERFSALLMPSLLAAWPDVPWPRDALHQWSRQYEYPFAFHHIHQGCSRGSRILDAGSGITFFPCYLRLHGFDVTCVDGDHRLSASFQKLNEGLPKELRVGFAQADLMDIPFPTGYFAGLCCVSVIEHLEQSSVPKVLSEFSRVLAPGGLATITVDVELDAPGSQAAHEQGGSFVSLLMEHGLEPVVAVLGDDDRPMEMLSTTYFRDNQPNLLPWAYPGGRSFRRRLRHWLRSVVLQRTHFEALGVGAYACRRSG